MAPLGVIVHARALTTSNSPFSTPLTSTTPSPHATGVNDIITNIVFGVLTCVIGAITIWQAHRAWRIWHTNRGSSIPPRNPHTQNRNNVPPPPYPETPHPSADELEIPSRTAAEGLATRPRSSHGLTAFISSEHSGIQLQQANVVHTDGLTSLPANEENTEHASEPLVDSNVENRLTNSDRSR
ncbi:MAG: hypothetical protein FRX48_06085 [Lasallia pustulata]|uniref:Uncharacterized protein n=1 Tax=Lasallia pustulata TaxID=136370 RepID=A0A5M8PQ48_9LECA|nr:MAG: hypothetical protein FRX48_06085 [Lasallia pustulata]